MEKLSFFAAPWEQEELLRPIFVDKAYKNTNHQVFITTDTLFDAIRNKKKVTFKDVAGIDEAKEELKSVHTI